MVACSEGRLAPQTLVSDPQGRPDPTPPEPRILNALHIAGGRLRRGRRFHMQYVRAIWEQVYCLGALTECSDGSWLGASADGRFRVIIHSY